MTVISVSLNDTILQEIARIQKEQGYSARSEVIRSGIRLLISESRNMEELMGTIDAILILIHHHNNESTVSEIKHKFEEITQTQIHSHLNKDRCLEIFVLEGKSKNIKEMIRLLEISKKMDLIKLIVA